MRTQSNIAVPSAVANGRDVRITPEVVASMSDAELLALRDILGARRSSLMEERNAWQNGNLIGYDAESGRRLLGALARDRIGRQVVKTELRTRGLSKPNTPPANPHSNRSSARRYEALVAAVREMFSAEDAGAAFELAGEHFRRACEQAERNRRGQTTNGSNEVPE